MTEMKISLDVCKRLKVTEERDHELERKLNKEFPT
jgi:hypothetical protein